MDVKSRHHLRADAIDAIDTALADRLGVPLDGDTYERVTFEADDRELVLVDGDPLVLYLDEESVGGADGDPFVTVRGANATDPERATVTVDAGAIEFVSDGADVMRPGIVAADDAIEAGDPVVIVEEAHGKALAVGRARVEGSDMVGEEGKVVDSIHHVGDDIYEFAP
ncbi:RNA-binding protein [Halococcoides cellulosivorans]|uniref:RNA-binding protein n=1 Tax=Halococcoides cellulosivorans TaxID=1679096 RepID=A0A2R4WY76_9EURY|nr:RNA-binding protein [Halococcoides cellulosivorans]AWB26495.1 RNA-binding protein [Halococcoides cellulosivorans]